MSWLDPFTIPLKKDGNLLPARRTWVLGDGLTATDDPENNATILASTGSAAVATPLTLTSTLATDVPLTVKGAPSQSAHLQDWKNSANTVKAAITAAGSLILALGAGVAHVDSSGLFSSSLIVDADVTAVGWAKITGTPTTLAGYGITDAAASSRTITCSAPLLIDGGSSANLSANRTLSISNATTGAPGAVQLAGDIAGTATSVTVAKINGATVPAAGALTTGNVLQVTGTSALGYAAVNLAGGANFVTGVLPAANQASQTMAGDVTGTTAASVVAKVNGATVPAAGALTTGNAAYVSGVSALTYSALNLAGGSGWVTGVLPVANLPSLAGDVTGAINANTVAKINATTITTAGGALATGKVLRTTGVAAADWGAVDLANANAITGLLPLANVTPGSNGQVLATASAVAAWVTPAGDVTGAPSAFVVAKINGTTISTAGGSLTTGKVLRVTGASSADWGAVDLANSSAVTGLLPVANVAAGSAAGQVLYYDGSSNAWSGAPSLSTSLTFLKTASGPSITHAAQTTDTATTDLTITSQGPFASASTNKNPGNLVLAVPAAVSGGTEGKLSVKIAGTERVKIGSDSGAAAFIAIGSNPAGSGAARFSNNTGFYGRNAANSADLLLLQLSSADAVNIGDASNGSGVNINAKTGGNGIQLAIGGSGYFIVTENSVRVTSISTTGYAKFSNIGAFSSGPLDMVGVVKTGAYTITDTDTTIFWNGSSSANLTLPAPSNGRVIVFVDQGHSATPPSVLRHGSEKIRGSAATWANIFDTNFQCHALVSDGTDWFQLF